jgi:pyruvate,phosphate dikinase
MEIYSFGLGEPVPADKQNPEILGGKGYGLVWMAENGLNVPPGFILPCSLMAEYQAKPKTFMKAVAKEIKPWLKRMTDKFGYMPLVSVRSGARQSMPGMMDTILNVGLDSATSPEWVKRIGSPCAINSEMRLVTMYGSVVKGLEKSAFERCENVADSHNTYKEQTGEDFPDATGQLLGAIEAVFQSWNNDRAKIYRKLNNIPDDWGTAVVVQAMVFGNMNDQSGTGVLFTRNPNTGEDEVFGEFAINAQGEDVVDGSTTPMPLTKMPEWNATVSEKLLETVENLEKLRRDVQDVEFTIQDGELFILQTRNAKRSPAAAVKIAVDMYKDGLIDRALLMERVKASDFDKSQAVVLDPKFDVKEFANGTSACSGVATGKIVKSSQAAINCKEPCILVTAETTPDDIGGMFAAKAIVTMTGGSTCHAAVVARGMNKPCIVGVGLDLDAFEEGAILSVDGATGRIWDQEVPVIDGTKNPAAQEFLQTLRGIWDYVPVTQAPIPGAFSEIVYLPSSVPGTEQTSLLHIHALLQQANLVYVDLRVGRLDPAELALTQLFVPHANHVADTLLDLMVAMSADDRARIRLIGAERPGFESLREVNSLQDMVLAKGSALLGNFPKEQMEAIQKVLDWQNKEGFQFASYGSYSAGAKNFLSDEAALQLV